MTEANQQTLKGKGQKCCWVQKAGGKDDSSSLICCPLDSALSLMY